MKSKKLKKIISMSLVSALVVGVGITARAENGQAVDNSIAHVKTIESDKTVINNDTSWRYLDNGTDPAVGTYLFDNFKIKSAWTLPKDIEYEGQNIGFDDTSWKISKGPYGAKNGEIIDGANTVLQHYNGKTSSGKDRAIETYFFRTEFNVDNLEDVNKIKASFTFDDSIVVYINGSEVKRYLVPEEKQENNMFYAGNGNGSPITEEFELTDLSMLKEGKNVIAVEVHQDRETSSDIYFGCNSLILSSEEIEKEEPKVSDISLTVGADESEVNFTWYTNFDGETELQVAKKSDMNGDIFPVEKAKSYKGEITKIDDINRSNKASAINLEENTDYVYRIGKEGVWSEVNNLSTKDTNKFNFLLAGDPQIGSGSIESDINGWTDTLNKAISKFPDASFLISAGDQVNKAGNEAEYDGYLSPEVLESLPVATNVGNHDVGINYTQHFNVPNLSTLGSNAAGGDYYFRYGNALFISLNSNNTSSAEHEQFIQETIEKNKDAKWRIVTFHHSIYSVASHSLEDSILSRRETLVPIFDKNDIDVVLMGHDHVYTRSYQMEGFKELKNQTLDNEGNVVDPEGTLYLTANSASGSKYYNILENEDFTYAAVKDQSKVPTISNIEITDNTFKVVTYRTDNMEVIDEYSIVKDVEEDKEDNGSTGEENGEVQNPGDSGSIKPEVDKNDGDKNESSNPVKTGDTVGNPFVYIPLMVLASGSILYLVLKKKKLQESKN